MSDLDLRKVEQQSIQDLPQVDPKTGNVENSAFWAWWTQRGSILPTWGTRERERWLRAYDRHEYNNLWQGASSGLIKKIKATPYELKGGRNLTNRFDGVLRDAQFGRGWGVFLSLMLRDYLRFDGGAYAEIIAPGNPLKAPTGAVTGIAHLDGYRCIPTGDPEYPVVYYARKGKLHILHHTRVLHLLDLPDGDQDNPGYGLCALSRAVAVVQRQINMSQYIAGKLDDKPQPGVVVANNINAAERNAIFAAYRNEQSTDLPPEWGKVAWVFGMRPDAKAELTNFTFAQPPEKFDYSVYVNIDVNELALAIGVDKQELWELSGATGTAGQSIIQAEKSEGKAPGEIRATLEREINNKLLPESLEFEFKVRDGRAAQQEATTAQIWVGVATSLKALLSGTEGGDKIAAEVLANQVPAVADALFDKAGNLRLHDADPVPVTLEPQEVTVEDSSPNNTNAVQEPVVLEAKALDDTRAAFVADFTDLVNAGLADEVSRRRAGTVLRASLNRLGKQARLDGLMEGGVEELSDDDLNAHAVWLADQSQYVTAFLDEVYSDGLTEAQVATRAEAWSNKSLMLAYSEGVQSADANGMYIFEGEDGAESDCTTCPRLKGQKHRMKEWAAKELRPGIDTKNFDCGGWECKHRLTKTTGRASGKW